MKLIKQRKKGQCGAACAAMVLGVELEDVLVDFPDCEKRGINADELVQYFINKNTLAIETFAMYPRLISILSVASLNCPGLLHLIVWDPKEGVLDPATEKTYPDDAELVNGFPCAATSIIFPEQKS